MESLMTIECTTTLKYIHYIPNERAEDIMVTVGALPQRPVSSWLIAGNVRYNPITLFSNLSKNIVACFVYICRKCERISGTAISG